MAKDARKYCEDFVYDWLEEIENVSRETFLNQQNEYNKIWINNTVDKSIGQLDNYVELLEKWQSTYNLIAASTMNDIWHRHIFDSVQLIPLFIPAETINKKSIDIRHIDFGSGGGMPAIIIAIIIKALLQHYPYKHRITYQGVLVESISKKAQFLNNCRRVLNLPIEVKAERIESLSSDVRAGGQGLFTHITARALADLTLLFDYSIDFITEDSLLFLLKGKTASDEIFKARQYYNFHLEQIKSLTSDHASILKIQSLQKLSS